MKADIYLYLLTMAGCTYLVRVIPLTLLRREIKNRFVHSFLYYVPYVTLSVMTFPDILNQTATRWSAGAAFLVAVALAYKGKSLAIVAMAACASVFLVERLMQLF